MSDEEEDDDGESPLIPFEQLQVKATNLVVAMVASMSDEYVRFLRGPSFAWVRDAPPREPSAEAEHLLGQLEVMLDLSAERMPPEAAHDLHVAVLRHLAAEIMSTLAGEGVKKFNVHGVGALANEVAAIERAAALREFPDLRQCLREPRQFCTLMTSGQGKPSHKTAR
mmetsp:Transcript_13237/g.41859  ORF Transcript_13237/g.41859 Transcript_13237/m.41859 type:complete len:168 (-) Transcript_13237:98-601(-)